MDATIERRRQPDEGLAIAYKQLIDDIEKLIEQHKKQTGEFVAVASQIEEEYEIHKQHEAQRLGEHAIVITGAGCA